MSDATWLARLLRSRRIVRMPIRAYRLGLGRLMGRRFVLVEHRGRASGQLRHVALEVVARDDLGAPVVLSGFGEKAQWCRNVLVDPRVRIWWGTTRGRRATAQRLAPGAARALLRGYVAEHPAAWRRLSAAMAELNGRPIHVEDFDLPMFALRRGATRQH